MKRALLILVAALLLLLVILVANRGDDLQLLPPPPPSAEPLSWIEPVAAIPEIEEELPPPPLLPPPAEVAEVPAPELAEQPTQVRLRDIATGSPLPGIELVGTAEDGQEARHVTNAVGEFLVEGKLPVGFHAEGLKIVSIEEDDREPCVVIWAYRLMDLEIQVVGTSPVMTLDCQEVKLLLLAVEGADRSSALSTVHDASWVRVHRLDRVVLPAPDSSGIARVRVPRLPGYRVCASAPGWTSAVAEMPCSMAAGDRVLLQLEKPSLKVTGDRKSVV